MISCIIISPDIADDGSIIGLNGHAILPDIVVLSPGYEILITSVIREQFAPILSIINIGNLLKIFHRN